MSDHFEDELRATMRAHDHEAPVAALPDFRADDGPRVPTGGRYTWLPIAAAAAAVATLVGITFALGPGENRGAPKAGASTSTTTAPSPLTCPAKFVDGPRTVPARPTGTVDGRRRLAPNLTPTHVVVCAYLHPSGTALTGSKSLSGDLETATDTLAWLPTARPDRTCSTYLTTTDADNYAIGLTYASGTVWVAAPGNHCEGATNGYFRTSVNLRDYASASYKTGRWTQYEHSSPDVGICGVDSQGRLGDDKAMVPGAPTAVTICTEGLANRPHRTTSNLAGLVRALNALPTLSSSQSCPNQRHVPNYLLRFDYAVGPPVWVGVTAYCRPAIDNGAVQVLDSSSVNALIADLLK